MTDHIVIPVDGSEEATRAARRGLELATVVDATVDVLYVVERKSLRLAASADEKTRLRERGESILTEIEEIAAELEQPVTTVLREGRPGAQICTYADEADATLLVIGRQGITGLGKRLLGGVTEHVLHRSEVPVFVVPAGEGATTAATDYERVLVPTDGSETAGRAIQRGATIASRCGATIHVLNVVDLQSAGGAFSAGGLEREFVDRLEARGTEVVDGAASEITEAAPDLNVTTDVVRTSGGEGAAGGIRGYAAENDVDLIVMGSHGRSNLGRQLLGSVTSALLRTVDVPILVVSRST
ncbi:universal stress protein [Natrinema sp. 1APR25-10V2]|uniref:universal stress protein n=1 Tax=Natrinema sp. 1APR25-10V2 TaxID=2951081 RepID=UPI00287614D4|nr:universal stress protein [Natrinema sp. 1APR25-10V2]MDS0477701.1 universal stress protein [Natrinema sp. 1APR25-10V2]